MRRIFPSLTKAVEFPKNNSIRRWFIIPSVLQLIITIGLIEFFLIQAGINSSQLILIAAILAASLFISVFLMSWISRRVTRSVVALSKAADELTRQQTMYRLKQSGGGGMEGSPNSGSGTVIQARCVQTFVKRVNVTFTALLLLGGCIMFFLIYLPLNSALQTSLINNFSQISSVNYQSFQNNVQRGLEGARSLSSRTMIKIAIEEYNSGKINMDELIAYCQSKYEDGAKALEYLVLAERFVGDVVIARYAPSFEGMIDAEFDNSVLPRGTKTDLAICIEGDRICVIILSPVMSGSNVLGYDRLVFDLTDCVSSLCTDVIETRILDDQVYGALTSGARTVQYDGETLIARVSDYFIIATHVQDNVHFVSKQDKRTLFAPINRLGIKIFIAGAGTLLGFIITIYLYVIRYAKRELGDLATSHIALEKVASEVNVDSLTKAGSRRYGTENLMRAFTDFQSNGASPLIVMFDIDCFKHINDSLGHDAGDRVLKEVVNAVYKTIRNEDMLFRWGGDEFVGIFYGVKEENALRFARKILDAVLSSKIDAGDEMVSPTISMGISYFKNDDREFSDVLKRADQAMYISKAEGRNRVNIL